MERTSNNFSVYFFSSPTRPLIFYTNYFIRDGLFPLFFVIFPNLFDSSCEKNKPIIKSVILKRQNNAVFKNRKLFNQMD